MLHGWQNAYVHKMSVHTDPENGQKPSNIKYLNWGKSLQPYTICKKTANVSHYYFFCKIDGEVVPYLSKNRH